MAWTYDANGLNSAGLTKRQQDYWDQQAVQQNNDLGYSFQPTYNKGYGGFQTPQELEAYRTNETANAQTRQVWNGAAGRYMSAAEAQAYGQGPNANPNVVFGGTPTGTQMQRSPTGMVGGTAPMYGTKTAASAPQSTQGGLPQMLGMNSQPYAPPAPAAGSATATNPFLNLGLNAYTQTQQPFDTSWLDKLSKSLYDQSNYNYQTNLKPTLDSNAIMAGGFGGDRAKIAEGVVMDRAQQNVINAMAPQYASAYQSSLDRALQGGNAAAGVGTGLEQLDLNRMLGLVGAQNQTRGLDATISQNAADLALREMLGLAGLENQRMSVENQTAQVAQNAAGVPTYTNPLAAGIGGAGTIAELLNLILNKG